MGGVGVLLGLALGWGPMNSLFLGVMLAMSSTMITMKNVEDLGMKEEKFAGLAMGTLVIEDLLAIFAMVVLSTIAVSSPSAAGPWPSGSACWSSPWPCG